MDTTGKDQGRASQGGSPRPKGLRRRLIERIRGETIERMTEKGQMSPAERRVATTSFEDLAADRLVERGFGDTIDVEDRAADGYFEKLLRRRG